jgi:phage anti-repressor protein
MQKELIPITKWNGKKAVHLKDLYVFLGLNKANWKRWCQINIVENGFARENEDWQAFATRANGNDMTEKGEEARNYFLQCEKIAKAAFTPTAKLEDHARREIQVKNSKEVNSHNYEIGGMPSVMEYNKLSCKLHSGKYPYELKKEAKAKKIPSKFRKSGKEILRYTQPVTACAMSLTDDMVKMGANLEEAADVSINHGTKIFAFMLKNGVIPGELGTLKFETFKTS